jgi:antitoxin (DNA-binding transcriptional repressor) of toxin-antitoxin stability system
MSSTKITVTHAARNLSDVVNRAAYRGEQFLLIKGKKPVAQLGPVMSGKKLRDLPETLAGLPKMMSQEELTAFKQDLHQAKKSVRKESLRDPWAS